MVHQQVDEVLEEVGLIRAERAPGDLVHGFFQLGDTVVVGHSVVTEDGEKMLCYVDDVLLCLPMFQHSGCQLPLDCTYECFESQMSSHKTLLTIKDCVMISKYRNFQMIECI